MSVVAVPEGCMFYHTIDLPGLGTIAGVWDHRATVEPYLGRADLRGKRVLEVGPANGFFSFELERRGARVVSLELGEDSDWDRVPHPYVTETSLREALRRNVEATRKAWLFAHELFGSRAETVRGTVYEAPRLVDAVEVSFFGNVLQHLRDPLLALTRVAEVTRETMIVSEAMWVDSPEFRQAPQLRLIPRASSPEVSHSFWSVSPAFVVETMRLLGFGKIRLEYHEQMFNDLPGDSDAGPRPMPHFTVVASRIPAVTADSPFEARFGDGWYGEERDERGSWRWSKDRVGRIVMHADRAATVCIGLGFVSATRGDEVVVAFEGQELWRGRTFDLCSVTLDFLSLKAGDNVLELTTAGPTNTTLNAHRTLGVRLRHLGVAPA